MVRKTLHAGFVKDYLSIEFQGMYILALQSVGTGFVAVFEILVGKSLNLNVGLYNLIKLLFRMIFHEKLCTS